MSSYRRVVLRRQRPDPLGAVNRLSAVVRGAVTGGWLPGPPVEGELAASAWLPEPLRGGQWAPGRRGALALAAVMVVAAVLSAFVLLRGRPHEVIAPATPTSAGPRLPTGEVVVAVAGSVRRPGLVRLPVGSRVDDAVRAAGGPLPGIGVGLLNLARKLVDGEQVIVGAGPLGAPGGTSAGSASGSPVDLNSADVNTLDALPGIGPVLAQHIVDWRAEHGPFVSIDQLREVPGIGESKFASLKSKVRV